MQPSKRQRRSVDCEDPRDSPRTRAHKNPAEQETWTNLPATALRNIFEILSDRDRFSAALICRGWYQGFQDPKLWKKRIIEFPVFQDSSTNLADNFIFKPKHQISGTQAIGFAKSFAMYLQDVKIIIDEASIQNFKDFSKLSKLLYKSKLNTIRMDIFVTNSEEKHFIEPLIKLIQNQNNLKEFRINLLSFDRVYGAELLKSLADVSGSTLQKLCLNDFCTVRTPFQRVRPITEELKRFYNLVYIKFSSQWLSDDLIKQWSRRCPYLAVVKLRSLSEKAPVVSNEAWQDLARTHPALSVEITGGSSNTLDKNQVRAVLPPAIPLYKLEWDPGSESISEFEIITFLRHLRCYQRTLTDLDLSFYSVTGYPDTSEVRSILSNFKKLKPFSITNEILEDDVKYFGIETELS